MDVEFSSNSLRRCYESSTEASRKWGPVVERKYIGRVNILIAAKEFNDLYSVKSLGLHKLEGDREGEFAITIHDRWRMIVAPVAKERVRVQEVTNHYGD